MIRSFWAGLACVSVLSCGGDSGLGLAGPSDTGPFPTDAGPVDAGPEIRNGCLALRATITEPTTDTYDNWAQMEWFEAYCTRCHSTANTTPEMRNFAPMGYNWDDPVSIREHLAEIRNAAGVVNYMPFQKPPGPIPTCEERYRLVRWIDNGGAGLPPAM